MKEVKLQSGAVLKITLSPFAVSKALYQALLEEGKNLRLDPLAEVDVNLFKDLFCVGMSSKKIEVALWECMKRATYNGLKIDESTFEALEAREDYLQVCIEVMKENVMPFMKSLSAQYAEMLTILQKDPA